MDKEIVKIPRKMFERMIHYLTIYYLIHPESPDELKELIYKLNTVENGLDNISEAGDSIPVGNVLSGKDENV